MVEREAPGDFDYLWDDPADSDGLTSGDEVLEVPPKDPDDDLWDEPDDNFWDNRPDFDDFPNENGQFDAFNDSTWRFTPAPPPWYRTKRALTAIVAASAALAAIVVSGVLLVVRGPANSADGVAGSVTPTAPTSANPVPVATSEQPPPPPPPATASQVNTAPRYDPTYQPNPTKAPEIGVTRTPVTRLPLSVAPQPRTGQHALR